jgi:protein gp37
MGMQKYEGTTRKSGKRQVWTGPINVDQRTLAAPLTWRKPQRIFVNSMSDLFQEALAEELVRRVWQIMEQAHWHTFQILTKRPERMLLLLSQVGFRVLPNVWLGTSVESEEQVCRIDVLRRTPAAVRFVSFEPLLGAISDPYLAAIHWAIVGGESGPGARPMEREWVEDLRDSCVRQGVAFFFKQWGGRRKKATGRTLGDGRGTTIPLRRVQHADMVLTRPSMNKLPWQPGYFLQTFIVS